MTRPRELTSLHNPEVRAAIHLKQRKGRRQSGLFLVEGVRSVREALASGWPVERLFVTAALWEADPAGWSALVGGVPTRLVSEQVLKAVSDAATPQGAVAVVRWRADRLLPRTGQHTLWVALDGVQDPGNVGTLLRSAAAFGADGVICGEGTVDITSPKVVRSSMGALFRLPVEETSDLAARLHEGAEADLQVVALDPQGERLLDEVDLTGPTALVIGNEGAGLSAPVAALAHLRVRIPMARAVESLNAAMAGTAVLYEAARQRRQRNEGRDANGWQR